MNKNNNNVIRKLEKEMTKRLITRIFVQTFALILALAIMYFMAKYMSSFRVWHRSEIDYKILKYLQVFAPLVIIILCGIGIIFTLIREWKNIFRYLSEMLEATGNIYNHKNELIELCPELKEVEVQMNNIKINIQESERAAKEAEQRKNDLVVYLAHDLKTPLTSVIGYLTLLRDEHQISDILRQKYIGISLEKSERLEDLINEFFEITRFNLTTLTLELSSINLTRMLQQILYEFEPMFRERETLVILFANGIEGF